MILSIIIPAYNAEQYLEKCVESCENQNITNDLYELIIVNDGSKDDTLIKAKKLAEKYENIKVFTQENQGTASARNLGMKKALGLYFWFVDADDYVEKNSFLDIYRGFEQNQFPDIFVVKMKIITQNMNIVHSYNERDNVEMVGRDVVISGFKPATVCVLICKSSYVQDYDLAFRKEIFLEDGEFSLRCMAMAKSVFFSDIVAYVYEKHQGSKTENVNLDGIYKKLWGNIPLVLSWKDFAKKIEDKKLNRVIISRCNSTLAGTLIELKNIETPLFTKQIKDKFLDNMIKCDCYPIHGPFLSWKMLLYSRLLNIRKFII